MTIPITSIIEGQRGRSDKKYGDIKGLAESIMAVGQIQPIVLSHRADDLYDLVAGGRRYRAIKSLGILELQHGATLRPGVASFVFEEDVPVHVRKEAELDENLHRLDCDWIDNVLMVADVHEAKKTLNSKWGLRQTAELLGKGYGKSNVNYAIRIAKLLRVQDKDILSCGTMQDAIAVLVKRKEDEALAELHRRTTPQSIGAATPQIIIGQPTTGTSSFLDTLSIDLSPNSGMAAASVLAEQAAPVVSKEPVVVPLSRMFQLGDFRTVLAKAGEIVDHVVTDIPYGIDMDNLNQKQIADVASEHEVEANVELMPEFLRLAFSVVKPGGFCVFFYDLDHHEKLQGYARDAGWKVQRWPLIAYKTSACQNNSAQYNFTKNYEVAMVLRKDEQTVLRKQQPSSVWVGDFAAERKLYNNPFAKPFSLW